MSLPDILIVADYKNLFAYMILPDGLPEIIDHIDCENDGQTSVPLVNWEDETGGCRIIADRISAILARYQPSQWGLACPTALVRGLRSWLSREQLEALRMVREIETGAVDISNVAKFFDGTAADYDAKKEHC